MHVCAIEPEERMSIDEQMIPYKGKCPLRQLRQYLPKKPKKWGFKVFARSGVSGITYDFHFYDGKGPQVTNSCGFQPGDFVLKLCETLPDNANFKVYFDNYFTFMELQLMLKRRGIFSVGTIRSNRLRSCPLKAEKELKKQGRGAFHSSVDANSGLAVVCWFDSGDVQLTSTHSATEPVAAVQRWDKKSRSYISVTCPAIVGEYNQFMGGVDLFDMLMSLYRIDHRSKKWYRRIFYWSIHLGIVNGWLIYRRHCDMKATPAKEQLSLIQFTAAVSESLISEKKVPPQLVQKRGRPSVQLTELCLTTQPLKVVLTVSLSSRRREHVPSMIPLRSFSKTQQVIFQNTLNRIWSKSGQVRTENR